MDIRVLVTAFAAAFLFWCVVLSLALGQEPTPDVQVDACGCEVPYLRGGAMYRHVMCELENTEVTASDALQVLRWSVGDRRKFQ